MPIEPFKATVIELALRAAAIRGFALAGGNALAAHGLLSRPTQDIDLFTPFAGGTGQVLDAIRTALVAEGYAVQLVRAAADGDFAELHVSRDGQGSHLDLGRDWRAHDAVTLDVGPVLHLDDAVGSKTTALLGRALPRDFIDIAAALDRYSRRQLLELAFSRDRALPAHRRRRHRPPRPVRRLAPRRGHRRGSPGRPRNGPSPATHRRRASRCRLPHTPRRRVGAAPACRTTGAVAPTAVRREDPTPIVTAVRAARPGLGRCRRPPQAGVRPRPLGPTVAPPHGSYGTRADGTSSAPSGVGTSTISTLRFAGNGRRAPG